MSLFRSSRLLQLRLHRNMKTIATVAVILFCSFIMFMKMCSMPCEDTRREDRSISDGDSSVKSHSAFIVVLILTGPKHFERRDTIRETWLAKQPENVLIYFAVGTAGLDKEELSTLHYEESKHHDLLLLPSLYDSYFNLTQKVVDGFTWLDDNVDFQFVLKVDDDTFVRMDVLLNELNFKQKHRLYWGFFDGRARLRTKGQWAERNFKLCDHYLPHARGGGYVLSSDLVHFIASNSKYLQKFNSEDISVGTWLSPLEINRIHDPRFDTEYMSRGCSNTYVITHKQNVQQMKELQENLKKMGRLCKHEYKTKNSYVYNWDVLPSLCCLRNDSRIP